MSEQQNAAATVEDLIVDQAKAEEVKGGWNVDFYLKVDGVDGESGRRASTPSVSEVVVTKVTD